MKIFLFIILLIVIGFPIYFMVLLYNHFKKFIHIKFTTTKRVKVKTDNPSVNLKSLLSHMSKQNK